VKKFKDGTTSTLFAPENAARVDSRRAQPPVHRSLDPRRDRHGADAAAFANKIDYQPSAFALLQI
jgi:hypothetical protein